MQRGVVEKMEQFCDAPPDDLVAHFSGDYFPNDRELAINILRLDEALKYTEGIQEHAVLGRPFGLIALDDANNSNPFCYITKGPTRGSILYLCHDGESRITFSSLRDFIAAIEVAIAERTWIEELRPDATLSALDSDAVAEYVARLLENGDHTEEICVLIPLLNTSKLKLMESLAKHHDFFIREGVAHQIAANPNVALLDFCNLLATDKHPQVARPGQQALAAVKRLIAVNSSTSRSTLQ